MTKLVIVGFLSISILSGCSANKYFSFPDKFDICNVDIIELEAKNDYLYISVGWCSTPLYKDK
jgi:hypothetical protein